jgi:glycosyltransferase involved in cell wall biosynthesis
MGLDIDTGEQRAVASAPVALADEAYPAVRSELAGLRVALVHDYLFEQGGAENVVEVFCELFPNAPLFTSIWDHATVSPAFATRDVRTSFMQKLIRRKRYAKALLPLYPLAFEQFDFAGFDLVLSSSSGFAKDIRPGARAVHVCYCHTPARFLWDFGNYLKVGGVGLMGKLAQPLIGPLRWWDRHTVARVDTFVANSRNTAARIQRIYGRASTVIYPPIDLRQWYISETVEDYYLVVSRLLPYKRIDIVIEAFNRLGKPLVIVGAGPDMRRLQYMAGAQVHFLGRVPRERLHQLYARAAALILPGAEDLGLTALEAQASGRPVIAYGAGGALETVVDGVTGRFFTEQTATSLLATLAQFNPAGYDPQQLRRHAAAFDKGAFKQRIAALIAQLCGVDDEKVLNYG